MMKPIHVVFIFIFIILGQLSLINRTYAQEEKAIDSVIKKYVIDTFIVTPKLGPDFNIKRSFKMPDIPEINRKYLPGNERMNRNLPGIREFENQQFDRQFPGASRYYARRPYLYNNPGAGNFIRRPDSSVKYYLIIKDPLRNTVTK